MKTKMIEQALNAIVYMLCVLITGMFIPTLIALLTALQEEVYFTDAFSSVVYWLFSTVGIICSAIYYEHVNHEK